MECCKNALNLFINSLFITHPIDYFNLGNKSYANRFKGCAQKEPELQNKKLE